MQNIHCHNSQVPKLRPYGTIYESRVGTTSSTTRPNGYLFYHQATQLEVIGVLQKKAVIICLSLKTISLPRESLEVFKAVIIDPWLSLEQFPPARFQTFNIESAPPETTKSCPSAWMVSREVTGSVCPSFADVIVPTHSDDVSVQHRSDLSIEPDQRLPPASSNPKMSNYKCNNPQTADYEPINNSAVIPLV